MQAKEREKTVSGEKEQPVAYQRQDTGGQLLEGLSLKACLPFMWPGQGLCEKGKKGKKH